MEKNMGLRPVMKTASDPINTEEKYRASILGYTKIKQVKKITQWSRLDKISRLYQNLKWKGLDTPVNDWNNLKP